MPHRNFDIEVPRQGDWFKEIQLLDVDRQPIDLTGHALQWRARLIAGTGPVAASATITVTDAAAGKFEARWHGPDFDAVGIQTEIVRVAHDLKDTYPDAVIDVPFRGHLILMPEVTA